MEILMKLSIAALVIGMQTTALGRNNYEDLVAEGYRWAKIDGPYACPTKEDLREITSNPSVIKKVHMDCGAQLRLAWPQSAIEQRLRVQRAEL
jgi:hypothetical protein